MLSNIM